MQYGAGGAVWPDERTDVTGIESGPSSGSIDLVGLVRSAQAGDEAAWSGIVKEYGPRVFALARSRLGDADAAEEVTQSVFATIAIKLRDGAYAEHGKFEPWLLRIAMNRVRDRVRTLKRERNEQRLRWSVRDEATGEEAERFPASADVTDLREAMAALSKADREIVELRYHAGLSFKQMADLLDEPIGTLLARHHRALRKLKVKLEQAAAGREGGTESPQTAGGTG